MPVRNGALAGLTIRAGAAPRSGVRVIDAVRRSNDLHGPCRRESLDRAAAQPFQYPSATVPFVTPARPPDQLMASTVGSRALLRKEVAMSTNR
ncbi:MAG TPA: hypothetical protein VF170_01845, partial [Planctomycetaceae bacterium]